MGQLEDILKHQNMVRNNIMKSFGAETSEDSLEKSFEDRDKAMEFMSRVPSKFKSSNRNIINALNATLKNLYIEHNK